ncbi:MULTISPECIES: B12-binding domain-containing radical SAM protein [unclassified Streptomyces]|uniref:B12-binding domain-containing radical SAM protein n=1 Tax=unclassified Streptomyces TaxID=2593676 RepID=UPI0036B9A5EA
MTTVTFVVADDEFERDFLQLPLDVANAAALLRQDGVDVAVWDRRLSAEAPRVGAVDVAVVVTAIADRAQCYPLDLRPVRAAVEEVRRTWPRATVLAVGPHATQLPSATLRELGVDHVARGEADAAAVHGLQELLSGRPVLGELPLSGTYPPLDFDQTPLPAYDLLDLTAYTAETFAGGRVRRGPCGMVLGVRGCTYGCTFCHLPFGTRMRPQPVERTLAEIGAMRERGVDSLFFLDYVFGLHPTFYKDLCTRLAGSGIGWSGQSRAEVVLRQDVDLWAAAGCNGMWLGAESPAVAETAVGKRVPPEKIDAAIRRLSGAGITPFAFILLGLPGDPACLSGEVVDWAASLPGYFGLNQLFLRPGTPLYDELAADYNDGAMPTTWAEVEAVTRRYRERYPVSLDDLWQRLVRLPNYIGNAMAAV